MKRSITAFMAIAVLVLASVGMASDTAPKAKHTQMPASLNLPASTANDGVLKSLGIKDQKSITQACCKICTVGKACGNTCISKDKICHVGPGCACNG